MADNVADLLTCHKHLHVSLPRQSALPWAGDGLVCIFVPPQHVFDEETSKLNVLFKLIFG